MLFFGSLGYAVVVSALMWFVPRSALIVGAIALPFGMGWATWPISNMPAFVLAHVLGLGLAGLAAVLDVRRWYMRYKRANKMAYLEELLEEARAKGFVSDEEPADARA